MKTNIYTKYVLLLIGLMILFGSSCQKEWGAELQGDVPRLFRPVIKGSLQATGNYIEVAWQKSIETKTFKVELSIDTFNTITNTVEVQDTSGAIIEDLLWEQLYQVRVTAIHSTDPQKNSLPADFGEIKTPRLRSFRFQTSLLHVLFPESTVMSLLLPPAEQFQASQHLKLYVFPHISGFLQTDASSAWPQSQSEY